MLRTFNTVFALLFITHTSCAFANKELTKQTPHDNLQLANSDIAIPPIEKLELFQRSRNIHSSKKSEIIIYIPIDKSCLNVIYNNKHDSICELPIFGGGYPLENYDYLFIDYISVPDVNFSIHSFKYSVSCRYSADSKKLTCDEPIM